MPVEGSGGLVAGSTVPFSGPEGLPWVSRVPVVVVVGGEVLLCCGALDDGEFREGLGGLRSVEELELVTSVGFVSSAGWAGSVDATLALAGSV